MGGDIIYLEREGIDAGRWDGVIAQSRAETLYAYSWYLDAVAERWSALVMDDYRLVMPLVWKRKFGVRYLYQPFFCQQLGIHGTEAADPHTISEFIARIPGRFRFGRQEFNSGNLVGESRNQAAEPRNMKVKDRVNYVLDLGPGYEEIREGYSLNARRNIKKSGEMIPSVRKDVPLGELIRLKRENDPFRRPVSDYRRMEALFGKVLQVTGGDIYGTVENGRLTAAAFFGRSLTRSIYLLSVSGDRGKESRAMFRIIDAYIMDHAATGVRLDFEGSTISTLARFFSGFGALPETYQSLSFNRMPFPFTKLMAYAD